MVQHTEQATVVIHNIVGIVGFNASNGIFNGRSGRTIRTPVQAFAPGGHGICGVLNDKLVVALQHALGMFSGEHPTIFRCAVRQPVIIGGIRATIVNAQFQHPIRVSCQLR